MTSDAAPGTLAALAPRVRNRTVRLAARALGELPTDQVPPPLRRAAAFAPARRARLAGEQIAALVESEPAFREALAIQVRALVPAEVAAVEAGTSDATVDQLDVAAAAYLVRPLGWEDVVEAVRAAEASASADAPTGAEVERLSSALTAARQETKETRQRLRLQVDKLKAENAQLRRTLGTTRTELKAAQTSMAAAAATADDVRQDAATSLRLREAETRRLRNRVSELEDQLAGLVRAERRTRDAEATRLRLLLDTVTEAATGLRQELALPPNTELLPADTVAAVEPQPPNPVRSVGHGLSADDPDLLRRLLELPRVHVIIDGYNVTKTAWPSLPLDQQRARLVAKVTGLVAGKSAETTVVFDGANVTDVPTLKAPRGIRVRFSPPGVIADELIRELVSSEPRGRPVVVVTSDRELADSVVRRGARSLSADALVGALTV